MKEFECCKQDFGSNNDAEYEFTLVMRDVEDSEYYDAEQGLVKIHRQVSSSERPTIERCLTNEQSSADTRLTRR